jgi:hypothetical protein
LITSAVSLCVMGWAWSSFWLSSAADDSLYQRLRLPVRLYALATGLFAIAYLLPPASADYQVAAIGYLLVAVALATGWAMPKVPAINVDPVHELL